MNKKTLHVLEYDKIIELLAGMAASPMARDKLLRFRPGTDPVVIRERLQETTEAARAISCKGAAPLGQFYDIGGFLLLARKGGSLSMRQLLQVLYNLRVTEDIKGWFRSDLPPLPTLEAIDEVLEPVPDLAAAIDRCILSEEEMADNASPLLFRLRRDILRQTEAIRAKLQQITGGSTYKAYLQDSIVTMRDGRYVVPVKQEHRGQVPGIVHDQSASGATLFIEPQVIVDMNNALRELELQEKAEVERILAELSAMVAAHFHTLKNNQKLLIQLDVIFAKGKLSASMKGEEPHLDSGGHLRLKQARHPLIDPKKVVAIDVAVGGARPSGAMRDGVQARSSAKIPDGAQGRGGKSVSDGAIATADGAPRADWTAATSGNAGVSALDSVAAPADVSAPGARRTVSASDGVSAPDSVSASDGAPLSGTRHDGGYNTLVVTGPNTGGKTVTLKTIGLLVLMAQSGLHIPASSESVLPVFRKVYADIGDEQSIEQSLSTFSSHMRNIVEVVREAGDASLVLLDELGAGTDPTEGAALAIAILETLSAAGATTVATTHYTELKKYALSTPGVENASMEFDVNTLSPTYRLLIGVPGRSNAFEIARKLGLRETIIDRAATLIERGELAFEDVISAVEADRREAEAEKRTAATLRAEAQEERAALRRQQEALQREKDGILAQARAQARSMVREARETAEEVQQELRALARADSLGERVSRFEAGRRALDEQEEKYAEPKPERPAVETEPAEADSLRVGDRVRHLKLDQEGEVLSPPDEKGDLLLQIGPLRLAANVRDIRRLHGAGRDAAPSRTHQGTLLRQKAMDVSISINVQGEALEDALSDVEKYLDDAYLAGLHEVTIIHGRGEGILRDGIRAMLRRHRLVARYRRGAYDEGGDGVTVVALRDR